MKMKFILLIPIFLTNLVFAVDQPEITKVSDLSVEDLRKIVRSIVQDSIEKCEVNGTMQGRAKVNLKVEGEVNAKMSCNFSQIYNKNLNSSSLK
jgi:hypothetical protein